MEIPRWSALLLEDQISNLTEDMTLGMIMTPLEQLVFATTESSVKEVYERMSNRFDQLPVTKNQKLIGMVFRRDLPDNIDENSLIKEFCVPTASVSTVQADQSIRMAVKHLCNHEICIAFDTSRGEFCGLLHYSDLNKQVVRIYSYLWVSALEMALAELLSIFQPDHESWISALADHRQIQVLGRCEFSRRQNIELSPVEGLELSDLINIWAKQSELLAIFELSKTQFQKRTNHLVELRHTSMHPVRSLVRNHADVARLDKQLSDLRWLVHKAAELIHSI
jgi:predicted transcriptional regulator